MLLKISDDFDMEKIAESGQCFRVRRFDDGMYRFITNENVVYIKDEGDSNFWVSCDEKEWVDIWHPYFDLDRSYSDICRLQSQKHSFIDDAMVEGAGLRILLQDPWEMLITFIISQRKSIPAIAGAVEQIAQKYGTRISTEYEDVYAFPTPQMMADATLEELKECKLGYRAPYVLDAIQKVNSGELDLDALSVLDDDELLKSLQSVYGVGKKVANCIGLFGYGRMACVPIDVWIARAIEEECEGKSPFEMFGEDAGIIQQYVFYYQKHAPKD
ncbi:MAG: hypothetical protein LUB61_01920 [Eggerthellaceae bacterium]|nr:hypothetical protein [Eggerthellaceae bacterium]